MKELSINHTVNWHNKLGVKPYAKFWPKENPDVEIVNIMDNSLQSESLRTGSLTKEVARKMIFYYQTEELTDNDLLMCFCTTMGLGTKLARQIIYKPLFNVDESITKEAAKTGKKLAILATIPICALVTKALLETEASEIKEHIEIKSVINEAVFKHLLKREITQHNKFICNELEKLEHKIDIIVHKQISLVHVQFMCKVPIIQVRHSGFANAGKLLVQLENSISINNYHLAQWN
jgi:hypothetical protein